MSTYSIDYISSKVYSKLPPINPKENGIIYSTDDCMRSSYKEDYSPRKPESKVKSFKPVNDYEISEKPFTSQSSYREDFMYNKVPKPKYLKPIANYSRPIESFDSNTNYKADFCKKLAEKRDSKRGTNSLIFSKSHDETMMSNYQQDFVNLHGDKTVSFRPNNSYKPTDQESPSTTSYQSEFIKFPFHRKLTEDSNANSPKPNNFLFADQSCDPIVYSTDYNDNFFKRKGKLEKQANFKPNTQYKSPEEIFTTTSSYNADFEKFRVEPCKSYKPVNDYQLTMEPNTAKSVYNDDFSGTKRSLKIQPIKPINQITVEREPIKFVPDYLQEFGSTTLLTQRRSEKRDL